MREVISVPALVAVLAGGAAVGVLIGVRVGIAPPPPSMAGCPHVADDVRSFATRAQVLAHGTHSGAAPVQ